MPLGARDRQSSKGFFLLPPGPDWIDFVRVWAQPRKGRILAALGADSNQASWGRYFVKNSFLALEFEMKKARRVRKIRPEMWTDEEMEKTICPLVDIEHMGEDGSVRLSQVHLSLMPEIIHLSIGQRLMRSWGRLRWRLTPESEKIKILAEIQLEEEARQIAYRAWRERQAEK